MSGYIGTQPVPQATQTRDSFTATSGQTSFATSGYTPNFLDVFLNGVKLAAADYTASNGSDVVLATGATTGDILEVVAYTTFDTANVTGAANFTVTGNLSVDGGTIKLDGNYPVGTNNVALGDAAGAAITSGGRNTLIGGSAGDALTVGQRNVVIGTDALSADTQGSRSVAIGQAALANQNFTSATDNYNVAVGFQAGVNVSTGITNTMIGGFALQANTTASENTALGYQAGFSTTTGGANTAVGVKALYLNTTAVANTALGWNAAYSNTTGASNVAIGYQSLASNTTASNNTAVGYQAAYSNTTGINNSATGNIALYTNTTGGYNSAYGFRSLQNNTTASYNTAYGYASLYLNTTGTNNVAMGVSALESNTTASNNTAVGYQAGYATTTSPYNTFIGGIAGQNTTGSRNTFLGYNSGRDITSGSENTILGRFVGNQGGLDIRTSSNNIVLSDGDGNPRGYYSHGSLTWALPPVASKTTAASANVQISSTSGALFRSTSSLRYKNTVNDATHGLDELLTLRPVTYKGNNDGDEVFGGLIAEEVHDAGLTEFVEYDDQDRPDALRYANMVSLCIKAIQEQQATITALTDRITALEGA